MWTSEIMVFVPLIPTGFIELGKKDYEGGEGGRILPVASSKQISSQVLSH